MYERPLNVDMDPLVGRHGIQSTSMMQVILCSFHIPSVAMIV